MVKITPTKSSTASPAKVPKGKDTKKGTKDTTHTKEATKGTTHTKEATEVYLEKIKNEIRDWTNGNGQQKKIYELKIMVKITPTKSSTASPAKVLKGKDTKDAKDTKCKENLNSCKAVPEECSNGITTYGCYMHLKKELDLFLRNIFKENELFCKVEQSMNARVVTLGYLYEQMIQQHKWLLKDLKSEAILKQGLREWVKTTNVKDPYHRFSFKKWITIKMEEWTRKRMK